jgi:predicted dehydrogenase
VRLRVGVIGLGESWERRHKPALMRLSDKFEVRAVYDEVSQRARIQAAEVGCDPVEGFTPLVERRDIDAVYVLGTPWYGIEPIRSACRAGKAVYYARPFTQDAAEVDPVLECIRSSGVPFMAEFPWRFYAATLRLMELLASGLGEPQLVFCEHRVTVPEKNGGAAGRSAPTADEAAQYMADWFRFVFGCEPLAVQSILAAPEQPGPCPGFETLVARFDDARAAKGTVRRFLHPKWTEAAQFRPPPAFQVVAQRGMAYLDMPGDVTWFDESGRHDESLELERPLGEMLSDRFYRTVIHGLKASPGLRDAEIARQMVITARAAAPSPVSVPAG